MTAAEFIAKWGAGGPASDLNERQGAQPFFIDLCAVLGVPAPSSGKADNDDYLFEQGTLVLGEARGYADVFYRNHFAWENKAPGKNLDAALNQLLGYSLALANPPLLVVCDRRIIRIHTQFNGHPSETHVVLLEELAQPDKQHLLRRLWTDVESFRPRKTNRDITEAAAKSFATLAEQLRNRGHHADTVAHFLTQCLFCFFAEDVRLLPDGMFERLVENRLLTPEKLSQGLQNLFVTMRDGGLYGADEIAWFNGGLFAKVEVPRLQITDVTELRNAASLNWSAIDVSIFGTLFERGLDPAKRSQLGAHYTDPATIHRLIEPVIERPLLQQWQSVAADIATHMGKSKKKGDAAFKKAHAAFIAWLESLRHYRILDPACGSGNFLFLGLKTLKDIEHLSHIEAEQLGLDRETDLVTGPQNVLGIELNEYAAELARVTVWIGELQWRLAHGYPFKTNPVLEPLEHIECRDALLDWDGQGNASVTVWPKADVVIGNPPFLGDKKMRGELGDAYTEMLRKTYAGRVPGGADLVCYWFDKSREAIADQALTAAGLVATNSIRGGANRKVLDDIVHESRIFDAWSDEPWVNEGAAVRVSLVAFGNVDSIANLDGAQIARISADLMPTSDQSDAPNLTMAVRLSEGLMSCFVGTSKKASFDVPGNIARDWLRLPNPNGLSNFEVVKPWINGSDIVKVPSDTWIVDFGVNRTECDSSLFEAPFEYVTRVVRPEKALIRSEAEKRRWWLHARAAPDMRAAFSSISRFVVTSIVAKHRLWVWRDVSVLPSHAVCVVARADNTTFGILHSRFHELWSLRMCTWLGVGNDPRYTPTTCFETFPFPEGLTPADTAHQRTQTLDDGAQIPADLPQHIQKHAAAIARAAHRLDNLRQNWLNPPEWTVRVPEVVPLGMDTSPYPDRIEPRPGLRETDAQALKKRTLTNLYNQRPAWLAQAHEALDMAVAAAYGWTD